MDERNLFDVSGRRALVTGASSGLGRHFAETLARAGASVVLAARRLEICEHIAGELRDLGCQAAAVAMDVTETASVKAGFDAATAAHGPVEILVNNAGVAVEGAFVATDDAQWRSVLSVNLDGVARVAREGAQRMLAARDTADGGQGRRSHGAIINIASVLGLGVLPHVSAYAVSKAGVVQLTKAMALELAREGIRVNAIAPGYFETAMNEEFLASEAGQKLMRRVPLGRAGEHDELDGALLLLASDAGQYMTGAIVSVDGGAGLAMG